MTTHDLPEVRRLVAQARTTHSLDAAVVSLTLAVNILIDLVEGHRHTYWIPTEGLGDLTTGPMQAT